METILILAGVITLVLGLDLAAMRWGKFNQIGGEKWAEPKKPNYHPGNCCLV
jgi:hypothetical protein